MTDSYNAYIPKEFNTLSDIDPTFGYFIKSTEDFDINCDNYIIDYKNLSMEELLEIRSNINTIIFDKAKEQAAKEQAAKEQAAKKQAAKEQATEEQATEEQVTEEQ